MSYRRVVITGFGGPELLSLVREDRLPEPKTGEVRVRVMLTSAAFTDVMIRKGKYPDVRKKPPFSPGYDMIGVVEKLGEGVSRVKVGQRVADLTVTGAYSEYICIDENRLTLVPDAVDSAEAVCLILSYMTAYQMLHRIAGVRSGQRILIHGAAGAVGSAMTQLGKLLDLDMYGTASLARHDLLVDAGVTPIDYESGKALDSIRLLTGDGVDAAFDAIGGESFRQSYRALRRGGKLVAYGFYNQVMGKGGSISLDILRLTLWSLLPDSRSTSFYSIAAYRRRYPHRFSEDLATLFALLEQGRIRPVIAARFPLSEARAAHEMIERRAVQGKIVLTVSE
jgi:NADPH:quinone reductase-like Zn-dependent oxidoreductase